VRRNKSGGEPPRCARQAPSQIPALKGRARGTYNAGHPQGNIQKREPASEGCRYEEKDEVAMPWPGRRLTGAA